MLPEIGLAKGACTLWEEELLLDYTIEVEDEQFKVHKVVMASVSDYFKAMLTGGMLESREDTVRLEGLNSLAVRNVIEFVYTGQSGSSKASAEDALACAVYLQIPAAVKIYTASLCAEVNKRNCFHILSLFRSYGIKDGIEHAVRFMKNNIEDILDDCKSEDLTQEEFLILMDCWGQSEWQLFVMTMQWLKKDHEQRMKYVDEIMTRIRFRLMSPIELAFIASMKEMGMISDSNGSWYDLVEKALKFHKLPTHQKVLDESEQAKVRTEPSPVCFGMQPSLTGQLSAISEGNTWAHYKAVNPPVLTDDHGTFLPLDFVHINNFYIVRINNGEHDAKFSIFDPRTLTWSAMASMEVPREQCALVYHENHLYTLGGYDRRLEDSDVPTNVIEKYDFHTNTWSHISSRLPESLSSAFSEAFSINGCIYIPGIESEEFTFDMLHCFDPQAGEWSVKETGPLPNLRNNLVDVDIHGEKVIAGIDEDLDLHYYKPSTNQWLVYDRCVSSKIKLANSDRGWLRSTGNTIYFVNYVLDKDVHKAECLCEKWTFAESGLRIDTVTDRIHPEWCYDHTTNFCALLSINPPSSMRESTLQ